MFATVILRQYPPPSMRIHQTFQDTPIGTTVSVYDKDDWNQHLGTERKCESHFRERRRDQRRFPRLDSMTVGPRSKCLTLLVRV